MKWMPETGTTQLRPGGEAGYPTGSRIPQLSLPRKKPEWKASDETHLPAEPYPPEENARISRANEDARRARNSEATPGKGPKAARS
jgi:hypothetical protein